MLIRRLRYWMESARRSERLREEMELHLAEKAAELQADGMTPEFAWAEARRRFGNVGLKHEESREIWIKRFWSELGQDVRYGCRTMAVNKAFSILAVPVAGAWDWSQCFHLQLDGIDSVALAAGGRSRVAGGLELA